MFLDGCGGWKFQTDSPVWWGESSSTLQPRLMCKHTKDTPEYKADQARYQIQKRGSSDPEHKFQTFKP